MILFEKVGNNSDKDNLTAFIRYELTFIILLKHQEMAPVVYLLRKFFY